MLSPVMDVEPVHDVGMILCCLCGTSMRPNAANMCGSCLKSQVDLSADVSRQTAIAFCRECGRYQRPPWQHMELESAELLGLCLKKIKGLQALKIVDAGFLWTEPHSRRLKVKLTVQKEAEQIGGVIVEQSFVVEIIVQPQQCEDCARSYTEHTWKACVQARQRVKHKRTFLFLEQLMIKHAMHSTVINLDEESDGLDFYFSTRSHAGQLVDFIQTVVPSRSKCSKRLVSQDFKSNTVNYKYTFVVEIVPICKFDLVCLPAKLAQSCGGISPLLLCERVASSMRFIDFETLAMTDVTANMYWRQPFRTLASSSNFVEYVIIDIEKTGKTVGKYALAEVTCARSSDFGTNDNVFEAITHLGNLLSPGDTAAGYDISSSVFNDDDIKSLKGRTLPDVILVKKTYPDVKKRRKRKRKFKLKTLEKTKIANPNRQDLEREMQDEEMFLQDLEEDPDMRSRINIYARDVEATPSEAPSEWDGDVEFPEVQIEELLNDLTFNDSAAAPAMQQPDNRDSASVELGKKRRHDTSAF